MTYPEVCWIVTYFTPAKETEPTVTAFNNADAAQRFYEHCKNRGDEIVCVDECPIFTSFTDNMLGT